MSSEKITGAYILPLDSCRMKDVGQAGGKNASLGEMLGVLSPLGIKVPGGFVVTVKAYGEFLRENNLREPIGQLLQKLDRKTFFNLKETGAAIRSLIRAGKFSQTLIAAIADSYRLMSGSGKAGVAVAVRSSATAEDLPGASFAGQHDSFLNVCGEAELLDAVQRCYESLFNDRAIKYREDKGFDHMKVGLSVGVQYMVRSDKGASGVIFTLDPESGFRDVILVTGIWGLGENIVQGISSPDEFYVSKMSLAQKKRAIIHKKRGTKLKTLVYASVPGEKAKGNTVNEDTSPEKQAALTLTDQEVIQLAEWSSLVETHYGQPMDIEWAKDGITQELFIVQARPETVHQGADPYRQVEYILHKKGKLIAEGNAIGSKIVSGVARVLHSPAESDKLLPGEILVTGITNPDWDPVMKKVKAIVTDRGGRTSHASIIARELGLAAIVGTGNASTKIKDGDIITVCCAQGSTGSVYEGALEWTEQETDYRNIKMPETMPLLIAADPGKAFSISFLPSKGVGLMRLEFVISNTIRIHPMALVKFDSLKDDAVKKEIASVTSLYENKEEYFIDQLSMAVGMMACAFYPREIIVRMSDFKTNEYANLLGGKEFEPKEENPMIGFRGASRYYHERYREGFRLECLAMKRVRDEMGFTNVKLMIPFCRTLEEGRKVVAEMAKHGLVRKKNGLEIYVMAEIPSNILLAEKFAEIFDGFSIGSNDLTQLTLGIDRDNAVISPLFNEKDEAARQLIASLIRKAKAAGVPVGLCGQAPSDFPEYARFLVEEGINSISFNTDALIKGIANMNEAERVKETV